MSGHYPWPPPSRSVLRRQAIQRGEPQPEFDQADEFQVVEGWSWCPVLGRFIKDREGHRPAAQRLCDGTLHLPAARLSATLGGDE